MMSTILHLPALHHIPVRAYRMSTVTRTSSISHIIPHQFSIKEAAHRFAVREESRYFSPTSSYVPPMLQPYVSVESQPSTKLTVSQGSPLRTVFLPLYAASIRVGKISYEASYGIEDEEVRYDRKGKPHLHSYTSWYSINGKVDDYNFSPSSHNACIYAGYTYPRAEVERLVSRVNVLEHTLPYDASCIDDDTTVDPFLMRGEKGRSIILKRLKVGLRAKVRQEIKKRVKYDCLSLKSVSYQIEETDIRTLLFPTYVLQYAESPPQIMAAIRNHEHVSGSSTVSPAKVMFASAVPSLALGLAIPGGLVLRAAVMLATVALSGAVSRLTPWLKYRRQKYLAETQKKENDFLDEDSSDTARREETESFARYEELSPRLGTDNIIYDVDPMHFHVLGLSPKEPVNEDIVLAAFLVEIRKCHPDIVRSLLLSEKEKRDLEERALRVTGARDILLRTIRSCHH